MTTKKHEVPQELLGSLLADYKKPEDLFGENGPLQQLTKQLVEKALDAVQTEHWTAPENPGRFINMSGEKEVLGLWLTQTEGAKF